MHNDNALHTATAALSLALEQPIFQVPGIGRRTSMLLYRAGVRTVAQFVALPDFLLAQTFGPSLVHVRQHAAQLVRTSRPGAYSLVRNLWQRLATA